MKVKSILLALPLVAVSCLSCLLGQQLSSLPPQVVQYADMVLYNGKILSANDQFDILEAVAVRGGKFLAVSTDENILAMAGPETERIDLKGRSVVPGFFDTHLHQAWVAQYAKGGGVERRRISFKDVASGLGEIEAIVATARPGQWLYMNGPENKALLLELRLEQLDAISPANPVVITTTDNPSFANSLALETVDWSLGGVETDPDTGQATGRMNGFALGTLTYERMSLPPVTQETLELQQNVLKKLNSQGLTTIIGRAQGSSISVLKDLWAQKRLTARVRFCHEFVRQNAHAENYLKRIGNLSGFGDEWMKIIGITVRPTDGVSGAGAMLTTKPKRRELPDSPFGAKGLDGYQNYGSTLEKSEYRSIILVNRYGWNISCLHSQGDGASQILLNAFEEANTEKPLQGQWAFDHGLSRSAENMAKAEELGVIFSITPKYLFQNSPETLIYQYGEEVYRMTAVRDMIKAGLKPVMESDIRGKYSAPLWNMEALITRTDENGKIFGANQAITREEALWMKTNWASYYSGDEKILGTIEVGKLADLVVLGDDYMTVPEAQISEIPVDLTIVGGRVVYDREKEGEIRSDYWQ